ncbi:MAG: carboxypeptidase regulatory-like domain-containing protein [Acidobacteria bacterium]|nr:carboxypeptidase regulatory-like domain-containing protein [Acidobacteriota bacterium]
MRRIIYLFTIVLLLSSSFAQISPTAAGGLRVIEDETRLALDGTRANFALAVENPGDEISARVRLEILAPDDAVVAAVERPQTLARGRSTVEIALDAPPGLLDGDALLWYRLRYAIVSDRAKTDGLVSFSQILPEAFELETISTEGAAAESLFRVRVAALNPANGKGVAGVALDGTLEIKNHPDKIRAENVLTDADGRALLEFKVPNFEMGENLRLTVTGRRGNLTREVSDDLSGWAASFAEIVTDKPLYRPEQTVNLRLYSYNLNRRPLKDAEWTIEIENEETDEAVFTEKVKTSRFGIAATAWKILEDIRLGNYEIAVKNAENDDVSRERIRITRYELPNFAVEAKPDRKYYLPGQTTARVAIDGRYLFGKPVAGGRVRIVSSKRNGGDEPAGEIFGTLDDDGKFSAAIDLSKAFEDFDPDRNGRFRDLHFTAYVTDPTTERTEPRRFDLRITRDPIHVYLVGDTSGQSSRLPLEFFVATFYADGRPASCDVDVYEMAAGGADNDRSEQGVRLAHVKTNPEGAARLRLTVEDARRFDVRLIAADGKGATGILEDGIRTEDREALRVETGKVVYRPGEPVAVALTSSKPKGTVFVDVLKDGRLLYTTAAGLAGGRAELVVPYRAEFKNGIAIAAWFENGEELVTGVKNIIYPTPTNLEIEAATPKDVYRPGADVEVRFRARDAAGRFAETALGVLVLDRAVEERARVESDSSDRNSFLNRAFPGRLAKFLDLDAVYGGMTVRDLKNLDLSKPLAPGRELAIELALGTAEYRLDIARSRALRDDLDAVFTPYFRKKMNPVADALDRIYREQETFPTDENSLRTLLLTRKIDFGALRDAWGSAFRSDFAIDRNFQKLTIWSPGADKLPDTKDDLIVFEVKWPYFEKTSRLISAAMRDYTERTGGFITDYQTLRAELLRKNLDPDALRDPWNHPYRFEFTVDRTNYRLTVKSDGKDGRVDVAGVDEPDDFTVWTAQSDYFVATKANLIRGFNEYVATAKTFPRTAAEMRAILRASGFDLDAQKDAYGRPYYVEEKAAFRIANILTYRKPDLKAVKQKLLTFAVRSMGQDGVRGTYDDFELANFTGATSEEEVNFANGGASNKKSVREKAVKSANGAVGGTVFDPNGAVIPGAEAKILNSSQFAIRTVRSDESGEFLIDNLPPGVYTLQISRQAFKSLVITNLTVEAGVLLEIDAMLEVGSVSSVVDVTAESTTLIDTTEASFSTNVSSALVPGIQPSFTPRVRDYFAETLVWAPELVTDGKGAASLKFKMADNLTTWKLYAVGSDAEGNFGLVEKELRTFQPFFAELDPPRVLTAGDRIALPVPVRNYTDEKRTVAVAMTENGWSKNLGGASRTIEIAPNSTANAVFELEATAPVTDGRQRVTALAGKDADAIEKPVTVRPNGREIVETAANLFGGEAAFDVNFPAAAYPDTRKTEIKIYPNMLTHVAESVDGLLERPHGCGEQTTSSTYPNLLVLKIEKELKKGVDPRVVAQARAYLDEGYKRLLNYQTPSGGFSYWGPTDRPNVALTAYVLRFLADAQDFTDVDEAVAGRARKWLLEQQMPDGSWGNLTAYVARSLARTADGGDAEKKALGAAVAYLQTHPDEIKDAAELANFGLAADALNEPEIAAKAAEKLRRTAQFSKDGALWTASNTPFNGWGTTADIETTALVLQLLIKTGGQRAANDELVSKAMLYLLKNKDRHGVWYSTQTTLNVLDALILFESILENDGKNRNARAEIFVNGAKVQEFPVPNGGLSKPLTFDATRWMADRENRVEVKLTGGSNLTAAQVVSRYYVDWQTVKEDSPDFDFQVDFDKLRAQIGEEITARVRVRRKNPRYGMTLAEIGLPPGAEVDRASLEKAKTDGVLSSYDILPDRLVVYSWLDSAPREFSFKFRPRFGMNAQSAPSVVYDYYNEPAKATLAPQRFEVR